MMGGSYNFQNHICFITMTSIFIEAKMIAFKKKKHMSEIQISVELAIKSP